MKTLKVKLGNVGFILRPLGSQGRVWISRGIASADLDDKMT